MPLIDFLTKGYPSLEEANLMWLLSGQTPVSMPQGMPTSSLKLPKAEVKMPEVKLPELGTPDIGWQPEMPSAGLPSLPTPNLPELAIPNTPYQVQMPSYQAQTPTLDMAAPNLALNAPGVQYGPTLPDIGAPAPNLSLNAQFAPPNAAIDYQLPPTNYQIPAPEVTLPPAPEVPLPPAPTIPLPPVPTVPLPPVPDTGIRLNTDIINSFMPQLAPQLGEWSKVGQQILPGLNFSGGQLTFNPTTEQQLQIGRAVADVLSKSPGNVTQIIGNLGTKLADIGLGGLGIIGSIMGYISPIMGIIELAKGLGQWGEAAILEGLNALKNSDFRKIVDKQLEVASAKARQTIEQEVQRNYLDKLEAAKQAAMPGVKETVKKGVETAKGAIGQQAGALQEIFGGGGFGSPAWTFSDAVNIMEGAYGGTPADSYKKMAQTLGLTPGNESDYYKTATEYSNKKQLLNNALVDYVFMKNDPIEQVDALSRLTSLASDKETGLSLQQREYLTDYLKSVQGVRDNERALQFGTPEQAYLAATKLVRLTPGNAADYYRTPAERGQQEPSQNWKLRMANNALAELAGIVPGGRTPEENRLSINLLQTAYPFSGRQKEYINQFINRFQGGG